MARDEFHDILERSSRRITFQITDENDAGVPAASLTSLTLTLYPVRAPDMVINGRDGQNVLNTNNVTVDASGNGVWDMQPADNQIVDGSQAIELHRALFVWTWAGGAKRGPYELDLYVTNLHRTV